uniref:Uncharacterized protein n=1 Tax=Zea mays TaxID=4577 RepID=C4J3E7_MAIZE|nr:unknown [Zea mays]ACR37297.1 unknown [Zea mays]
MAGAAGVAETLPTATVADARRHPGAGWREGLVTVSLARC